LALPELEKASKDKHPAVRRTALQAIYAAFPKREGAYEAYSKAYDEELKWRILNHYKNDLKAALASLTKSLQVGNALDRKVAANDLGNLGEDAVPAVPALLKALATSELDVRLAVLRALESIRMPDAAHLTPLLEDPEPKIRDATIEAIGAARKAGSDALDGIVGCLTDPNEDVRDQARWTVTDLGARGVAALVRGLARNPAIRLGSLRALAEMESEAQAAIPAITKLLDDSDEKIRDAARKALDEIDR